MMPSQFALVYVVRVSIKVFGECKRFSTMIDDDNEWCFVLVGFKMWRVLRKRITRHITEKSQYERPGRACNGFERLLSQQPLTDWPAVFVCLCFFFFCLWPPTKNWKIVDVCG